MTPPRVSLLNLLAILLAACLAGLGSNAWGADPILRFPDGITWKGIFDSGFRPKHVSGLEVDTCEIVDQTFQFEFKGKPDLFPLDRGLLSFQLKPDNSLRMIWHQSRVPVSMKEGRRRLEQFEEMVESHIFQKGRMPILVDTATASVATGSEFDSIALVDGYVIHYGFDSSFQKDSPLIPHFYVSSKGYMGEPILRSETVVPPEGYDWYSLDPKIDTPAPGIRRAVKEPVPPQPGPLRQLLGDAGFFEHPFRTLGLLAVVVGGMVILIIIVLLRLILAGRG